MLVKEVVEPQGGLKSGKTATKSAVQQKQAGKGEKIGKVVGVTTLFGMQSRSYGRSWCNWNWNEVGERVGGSGKKIDKMSGSS